MSIFRLVRPPDVVSILNAIFGFGAILMACRGSYFTSVAFVILAAAADGFDGLLARRMGESILGVSLDSLADFLSFGIAPATLVWTSFGNWTVGGVYMSCGMLRLARFNVTSRDDKLFEGLPITAAGMIVATSVLLHESMMTLSLMLLLSGLMISSIPYPKIGSTKYLLPILIIALLSLAVTALLYKNGIRSSPFLISSLLLIALAGYLISPLVILCRR